MNPISDLTYRGYDGPLKPPTHRWWVIARIQTMITIRKRLFWLATAMAGWYFLILMVIFFFTDQLTKGMQQAQGASMLDRIVWRHEMVTGFSYGSFLFMVITLFVGAGSIANDNKANALIMYLSKPCRPIDYVIGKFLSVFFPLFIAMMLPSLVFYLNGAVSYRNYGFLSDVWLLPKIILAITISATFSSSLILACSSIFKKGSTAGVTYAGIYLVLNIVTKVFQFQWMTSEEAGRTDTLRNLYYSSIDGLQIGLIKALIGTDGGSPLWIPANQGRGVVSAPPLVPILLIIFTITAVCLLVFSSRVKAVEVVR